MKILRTVFALAIFSAVSPAQEGKPEQQRSYSPDKKWEFRSDTIVRAGATEPALQLSRSTNSMATNGKNYRRRPTRLATYWTRWYSHE